MFSAAEEKLSSSESCEHERAVKASPPRVKLKRAHFDFLVERIAFHSCCCFIDSIIPLNVQRLQCVSGGLVF